MKKPIANTAPTAVANQLMTPAQRRWSKFKQQLPFWILVAIPIAYFVIFKYWPMFGVSMAFQNYKAGTPFLGPNTKWVGLQWFERVLNNPYFPRWVKNTLALSLASMFISFPITILMALLLNEIRQKRLKKFTSTLSLLPHFISTVVIVGILFNLFSVDGGLVNQIIVRFGGKPIDFMGTAKYFRPLYIGSGIWAGTGFSAVVFTAAISGIDPTLYDAAAIDGSTRVKNVFYITIPCIAPTIITMFILKIGSLLSVGYEKIILMSSPAIYSVADTLSTYSYRAGILEGKTSLSTAIGLMNSVVELILIFIANTISKKVSETSLW